MNCRNIVLFNYIKKLYEMYMGDPLKHQNKKSLISLFKS